MDGNIFLLVSLHVFFIPFFIPSDIICAEKAKNESQASHQLVSKMVHKWYE